MVEHEALRIAVSVGTMHLPRMHFVVAHAAAMRAVDVRVFAVAVERADLSPVPVTQIASGFPLPDTARRRLYPAAQWTVGRRLSRWKPDVVNLHFLSLGSFATSAAMRARAPVATTVHAAEPFLMDRPTTLRQRFLRDNAKRAMDASTLLMAVSEHVRRWLIESGADPARVVVEYLGIDTEFWRSSTQPIARHASQRLVFVGHLTDLKGVLDVIEASRRIYRSTPHRLDIVGDGPLVEDVRRAARQCQHITAHGVLDRYGVKALLNGATALCLPTRPVGGVADAAPTVLLEAQSMGVPVVAYDTGGTSEVVADPSSLVRCGDLGSFEARLSRLLTDEDFHHAVSSAARSWIVENRALTPRSDDLRARFAQLVEEERRSR